VRTLLALDLFQDLAFAAIVDRDLAEGKQGKR
jgi:hypothetical protein